jgi:hypothetical protein
MGGEFCSFAYSRSPMIEKEEKERKEVTLE